MSIEAPESTNEHEMQERENDNRINKNKYSNMNHIVTI
jgi:hypothetical protein